MDQNGRKEKNPAFWARKEGRRKIQSVGPERSEEGRYSLLGQKGRRKIQSFGHKDGKEADSGFWSRKEGRRKIQYFGLER